MSLMNLYCKLMKVQEFTNRRLGGSRKKKTSKSFFWRRVASLIVSFLIDELFKKAKVKMVMIVLGYKVFTFGAIEEEDAKKNKKFVVSGQRFKYHLGNMNEIVVFLVYLNDPWRV